MIKKRKGEKMVVGNKLGNVVLEVPSSDGDSCCFGMFNLPVGEKAEEINDGFCKYILVAMMLGNGNKTTEKGKTAELEDSILKARMVRTGNKTMEIPRLIVTRDGRVFLEKTMMENDAYMKAIPGIIKSAWKWFLIYPEDNDKEKVGED